MPRSKPNLRAPGCLRTNLHTSNWTLVKILWAFDIDWCKSPWWRWCPALENDLETCLKWVHSSFGVMQFLVIYMHIVYYRNILPCAVVCYKRTNWDRPLLSRLNRMTYAHTQQLLHIINSAHTRWTFHFPACSFHFSLYAVVTILAFLLQWKREKEMKSNCEPDDRDWRSTWRQGLCKYLDGTYRRYA